MPGAIARCSRERICAKNRNPRVRSAIFNLGALGYDTLVRQDLWREQIRSVLTHAVELPIGARVLDIGCGPGISTFVLGEALKNARAQIFGADIAPKMIERAVQHHRDRHATLANIRFLVADASALPFADRSFDLIVGHSFLYLVEDRSRVLAELRRVLAPAGTLVLMEPNRDGSLVRALAAALQHPRALDEASLRPNATLRFAASMVLWRAFSAAAGRMSPELADRLFRDAGFTRVSSFETLAGLGLHCVARVF